MLNIYNLDNQDNRKSQEPSVLRLFSNINTNSIDNDSRLPRLRRFLESIKTTHKQCNVN